MDKSPQSPPVAGPSTVSVGLPSGEKSWDDFLSKYASGEMITCNFTDGHPTFTNPTSPTLANTTSPKAQAPPLKRRSPPTRSPRPSQAGGPLSPTRPPLEHFPSNTTSQRVKLDSNDGYDPDSGADSSTDLSALSNVDNQDPDIPDMISPETPDDPTRFFRQRAKDDPVQEEGLTRENMKNLNHDQEVATDKVEVRPRGSKGKKSAEAGGEAVGARRRGMRAELASVNDDPSPNDSTSSPEEGERKPFVKRPTSRSRGSYISRRAGSISQSIDRSRSVVGDLLVESASGTSVSSGKSRDVEYDPAADRKRIREFYEQYGYMPAPKQTPDAIRRRLRVIRRLGLDSPTPTHRETMNRFTRLAIGIFKTEMALVSIVGKDEQTFLSEIGFGSSRAAIDTSLCAHSIVGTGEDCLIVPDASRDWRFSKNPHVDEGRGKLQFYAGAPLRFGSGPKAAIVGSLCVIDNKPREFGESDKKVLSDLATCVVSELELIYSQQASVDSAKLHQISVEFLRRSLKNRPTERAGSSGKGGSAETGSQPSEGKRISGKDAGVASGNVDIYDEACREIRYALDAYAVAVVDLSQFHLFYPAYQSSSTAGTSTRGGGTGTHSGTNRTGTTSMGGSTVFGGRSGGAPTVHGGHASLASESGTFGTESLNGSSVDTARPDGSTLSADATAGSSSGRTRGKSSRSVNDGSVDEPEAYSKSVNRKVARKTYAVTDPTAPSRTPQVLFIPSRKQTDYRNKGAGYKGDGPVDNKKQDDLSVLGYSCENDGFAFSFTSSPAARKIISDFIASNVKTRKVWYTRDDSEGIAQSINHLMPPGTETSMAMPVFGFNGQVAFAVVACWTDPLYTYPAGAMQFVETIAGSLLASVMKERLHQVERSQLTFAAAASHELRTPLHQINAAATLLRSVLQPTLNSPLASVPASLFQSPNTSPTLDPNPPTLQPEPRKSTLNSEDRHDALNQLEIIEANGLALGNILENIIDTLDIGRMTNRAEEKMEREHEVQLMSTSTAHPDTSHVPIANEKMTAPPVTAKLGTDVRYKDKGKEDRGTTDLRDVLEKVVEDCLNLENKSRRVAGRVGLDEVEVILEVLPRNRGGWLMDDDPGPLSRAVQKIVHNACKFTEKGHVHITVQDVSRDVVLPGGYDNSMKVSTVFIDVKDSGRGMTPEFLDTEVLRPFTKADPFMPGSGLGLGLAQRMIEILGGKLAIASTLNKGTLVHIEIPLHLLNRDAESDESQIEDFANDRLARADKRASGSGEEESSGQDSRGGIREDGIYLAGFDVSRSKDSGVRRVGKSLLRQLKLNFCRVVTEIGYASLIIAPDVVEDSLLVDLHRRARSGAQIIILEREGTTTRAGPGNLERLLGQGAVVKRLNRPLRPSVMRRIMRPPKAQAELREVYQSAVVGGPGASGDERQSNSGAEVIGEPGFARVRSSAGIGTSTGISRAGSTSASVGSRSMTGTNTDDAILPSPPVSPAEDLGRFRRLSLEILRPSDSDEERKGGTPGLSSKFGKLGLDLEGVPPIRPVLGGHNATDPLPLSQIQAIFNTGDGQAKPGNAMDKIADALSDGTTPSSGSGSDKKIEEERRGSLQSGKSGESERPAMHERNSEPVEILASPLPPRIPGDPLRVLVAEDNAVNRKILVTMLKRTACHYAEAIDGVEAVQRFTTFHPDLVLLDINMPRKDGFAAATEMRAFESKHNLDRRARIIAVTAMGGEAARRRGLAECGIDEWKTKPVGIKDLREDVERLKTL